LGAFFCLQKKIGMKTWTLIVKRKNADEPAPIQWTSPGQARAYWESNQ
jgi:hypothetical protein